MFTHHIFKDKSVNLSALKAFGFKYQKGEYVFRQKMINPQFEVVVRVLAEGTVFSDVIDVDVNEPYQPVKIDGMTGAFVGGVRQEYEKILQKIAEDCFVSRVFVFPQTKQIIDYVEKTYGDKPEFLWPKSPKNAIFRRKDTNCWYGALLSVMPQKIGLFGAEPVEVLNLRIDPVLLEKILDYQKYLPAFHMNKKHWMTLVLNNAIPFETVCSQIDYSFQHARR